MSRTAFSALSVVLNFATLTLAASLTLGAAGPASALDSPLSGFSKAAVIGASAESVVIETKTATYKIKKIELQGSPLTSADLTALLDPNATTSLADRFAKLTAAEIVIPEIIVTTKMEPVQTVVYQNVKLTDVKQGIAASADIESVHSTLEAKTGTIEGIYGRIHEEAIDLPLSVRVMSETRKDDAEPLKTLSASFSFDGFKLNAKGEKAFTMTFGSLTGHGIKGRALTLPLAHLQGTPSDPSQQTVLIKDVLMSFEMDDIVARDIAIQSEADGAPVNMSFAKISMTKFGGGKITDIDFDSFSMSVKGSEIKIGDIDFKGIDFQKLRSFSANSPSKDTDPSADPSQQAAIFVPNVAQFVLNKANIAIADETGPSAEAKVAFSVDHFEVDSTVPVDAMPTRVTANLDHVRLDLGQIKDKDLKPLLDMGYLKLDLSSRIDMSWNAGAEELTINDISFSGIDMGAVKIAAVIGNITKDFFSGDSVSMQAAAMSALIKKFEIHVDNAGLFEKAIATQAKSQNKPVEDIKKSYVTAAIIGVPATLGNRPAAKMIGAALAKFLANPKSFHLIAISADGLGAADFALVKEPGALLDSLDITVNANE